MEEPKRKSINVQQSAGKLGSVGIQHLQNAEVRRGQRWLRAACFSAQFIHPGLGLHASALQLPTPLTAPGFHVQGTRVPAEGRRAPSPGVSRPVTHGGTSSRAALGTTTQCRRDHGAGAIAKALPTWAPWAGRLVQTPVPAQHLAGIPGEPPAAPAKVHTQASWRAPSKQPPRKGLCAG